MSRRDFYEMRPGEFWEALRAHTEEKNTDRRHIGELVRGATLRLFNLQVDKRYRITDPRKFWAMPWDDAAARKEEEEIKRLGSLSEAETAKEVRKFMERINNGKLSESQG